MRDKSSPELVAYLEAENAYTLAVMAPTEKLQAKLYAEMLSHIKETDESVPYRNGGWFYYVRTVEGRQYPIHCRRLATGAKFDESQPEEILLDVNQLAEGQPFMSVGEMTVSPDGYHAGLFDRQHRLSAVHPAHSRSEDWKRPARYCRTCRLDRLGSGFDDAVLHDRGRGHEAARSSVSPSAGRCDGATMSVVYEEKDERFNLGVGKTRDRKYLLMEAGSHTTNECRFLPADTPEGEFQIIAPRVDEQEYSVDHRDGLFYIRTNDVGKNFRVVTAPVRKPGRDSWQELIPLDKDAPLGRLRALRFVLRERAQKAGTAYVDGDGDWSGWKARRITRD